VSENQKAFLEKVFNEGGFALVAESVEDVKIALEL
jgi:hypothetical protein